MLAAQAAALDAQHAELIAHLAAAVPYRGRLDGIAAFSDPDRVTAHTAASRAQCLQMVADYAAAHPERPVWGHGWDESAWPEDAPLSTGDLDRVLGDRPAYLARVDVHSAVASTALRCPGGALRNGPPSTSDKLNLVGSDDG